MKHGRAPSKLAFLKPYPFSKSSPIAVLCLVTLAGSVCCGSSTSVDSRIRHASPPTQLWYGLFFMDQRIGYCSFIETPSVLGSRKAVRLDSVTKTNIVLLGQSVSQDVEDHTWTDAKTGSPIVEDYVMSSGGETTRVNATFTGTAVHASLTSGGETTIKVILIPPGTRLSVDEMGGPSAAPVLKTGQVTKEVVFNPVTLSLDTQTASLRQKGVAVKVEGRESATRADVLSVVSSQGTLTIYVDRFGVPLRVEMPAGLRMVLEDKSTVLASAAAPGTLQPLGQSGQSRDNAGDEYEPSHDLAVATAVSPTGSAILDPRTCGYLKVLIKCPGKPDTLVTQTAIAVPVPGGNLPIIDRDPRMRQYLEDEPYLSVSTPGIRSTAKQVVGTNINAYEVAQLLHDWVHNHVTPLGSLGIPRSASDVLSDPNGVCRDYATLYTGLARAAGLPTRLCAGIVAFRGRFYYHAWAESFVGGKTGWLPIDPTLPGMFVDATHVALAKGDPTTMFMLAGDIGSIKAKVLESGATISSGSAVESQ